MKAARAAWWLVAAGVLVAFWAGRAMGNAGPFIVKYPSGGNVAAEGVLARLDPTLKPARESRLRVVKEDLTIDVDDRAHPLVYYVEGSPPLASVRAAYAIENRTDERIEVDFGFPILRGNNRPLFFNALVQVEGAGGETSIQPGVISDSLIYGIIRRDAQKVIEKGIGSDGELSRLIAAII